MLFFVAMKITKVLIQTPSKTKLKEVVRGFAGYQFKEKVSALER